MPAISWGGYVARVGLVDHSLSLDDKFEDEETEGKIHNRLNSFGRPFAFHTTCATGTFRYQGFQNLYHPLGLKHWHFNWKVLVLPLSFPDVVFWDQRLEGQEFVYFGDGFWWRCPILIMVFAGTWK